MIFNFRLLFDFSVEFEGTDIWNFRNCTIFPEGSICRSYMFYNTMPLILISENTSTSDYGTKRRMECKDFLSDNVWIVQR